MYIDLSDYIIDEKSKGVILCSPCKGTGKLYERTSAYDDEEMVCGACKGSGRLVKIEIKGWKAFEPL